MSVAKLIEKIHKEELYWSMLKLIGYGGFGTCELASRTKPLVKKHGARKVAAALNELCCHTAWRTQLSAEGRKAAWSVLGPPPDSDWAHETWDHKPLPRPDPVVLP